MGRLWNRDTEGGRDVTISPMPPSFGEAAFRGSITPNAAGPRPARDPADFHRVREDGAQPIQVGAEAGAPSGQRRNAVGILPEYASGIPSGMIRQIFVSPVKEHTRTIRRRMGAPLIVAALTPSRSASYRAPIYVGVPTGADPQGTRVAATPSFRLLGRR